MTKQQRTEELYTNALALRNIADTVLKLLGPQAPATSRKKKKIERDADIKRRIMTGSKKPMSAYK